MTSVASLALLPVLVAAAPQPRVVTLQEAIDSTRDNNITWASLEEFLVQADAGKSLGWALLMPKLQAEGQWLHMGERHSPDFSGMDQLSQLGPMLGDVVGAIVEEHPAQAQRFAPYLDSALQNGDAGGSGGGSSFDDFIPPKDTLSATFSLVVPVITPSALPFLRGAYDQYDAAVQRVGHGREKLLYGVAQAYYGLLTLQSMIEVAERSIEAARQHFETNRVKASLQAVTELQVKRAELEVAQAETQKAELTAQLEKAKAAFRYLTGIDGPFEVVEPELSFDSAELSLDHWQSTAEQQRKDLVAARIETSVADHEVGKVVAKYFPNLNFIAQGKVDNAEQQRFDDDPFSWNLVASLSWNLWDGGIREAEMQLARSRLRQSQLTEQDLERQIESEVAQSYQGLQDAAVARRLAERQVEVAQDTQSLAKASEQAGVATNLEVIDANTMVSGSEAQLLTARLKEAMAALELLAAAGLPPPFEVGENTPQP